MLIRSISKLLATLALPALLATSCADDTLRDPAVGTGSEQLVINISVPSAERQARASRADNFDNPNPSQALEDKEGNIEDIQILLYNSQANGAPAKVVSVGKTDLTAADAKHTENITGMLPGIYNLYVIANSKANGLDIASLGEPELLQKILDWKNGNLPQADKLPMVYEQSSVALINGQTANVDATMKIAAVKVRMNIIFDKRILDDNGAELPAGMRVKNVKVVNVANDSKLIRDASYQSSTQDIATVQGAHYTVANIDVGDYYNEANANTSENIVQKNPGRILGADDTQASRFQNPWVWQGLVYVPERYVATNGAATRMVANVEILDAAGSVIGEKQYTIDNLAAYDGYTGKDMPRGNYYEIVGRLRKADLMSFRVSVKGWDIVALNYEVGSQRYELIVEDTKKEVSSGEWTELWYRSDIGPGEITFEFPDFGGKPFYTAEVKRNADGTYAVNENGDYIIRFRINPEIPYSSLSAISDQTPYKYFHVVAGALHKKIEVDPLNLDPFLTLDPQVITIDVREYISSGKGADQIPIVYDTNVSGINISIDDPSDVIGGKSGNVSGSKVLQLKKSDGSGISGKAVPAQNNGLLMLDIKDLMSGNNYWQQSHDYTLTFTMTVNVGGHTRIFEKDLRIIVKPYTTDYIIHFKAAQNTNSWNAPHIYVYQALQLPWDISETALRGKTVGYHEGDIADKGWNCGLEYAFSNNVTFKGWTGYGGPSDAKYSPYGWTAPSASNYGFATKHSTYGWSYCPKSEFDDGYSAKSVYDFYIDYNSADDHSACSLCNMGIYLFTNEYGGQNPLTNSNAPNSWKKEQVRLWPGVVMEKEEDGWWKYTLTGIATPGKAMIMFANGHNGDDNLRYPADNVVGVPLFDYPDHEGWFLYDTSKSVQGFTDDKPGSSSDNNTVKTYRFYWPKLTDGQDENGGNRNGQYAYLSWSGNSAGWGAIGKSYNDNWWYYEFTPSGSGTSFVYKIDSKYQNSDITGSLNSFTKGSDGKYHGYITTSNTGSITGGIPSGSGTVTNKTYRIYWPKFTGADTNNSAGNYAYFVWPGGSAGWSALGSSYNSYYYYYEFTVSGTQSSTSFTYKFDSSFHGTANITESTGLTKFTESGGKYHAYVDWDHTKSLQSGIPTNTGGTKPVTKRYIYFRDETSSFSQARIHIWNSSDSNNPYKTWGTSDENMTKVSSPVSNAGGQWWRYEIPSTGYNKMVIYDSDENPKSGDLDIPNESTYQGYYSNSGGTGWYTSGL